MNLFLYDGYADAIEPCCLLRALFLTFINYGPGGESVDGRQCIIYVSFRMPHVDFFAS